MNNIWYSFYSNTMFLTLFHCFFTWCQSFNFPQILGPTCLVYALIVLRPYFYFLYKLLKWILIYLISLSYHLTQCSVINKKKNHVFTLYLRLWRIKKPYPRCHKILSYNYTPNNFVKLQATWRNSGTRLCAFNINHILSLNDKRNMYEKIKSSVYNIIHPTSWINIKEIFPKQNVMN